MNFADSTFAIGASSISPDLRYIKQIKVRSGRAMFERDHVPVFRIAKFDLAKRFGVTQQTEREPLKNFLGYNFVEFGAEDDHLERPRVSTVLGKNAQVTKARLLARSGKSVRDIAAELSVSRATAQRYAKQA